MSAHSDWVEEEARRLCGCRPCVHGANYVDAGCARERVSKALRRGLERAADVMSDRATMHAAYHDDALANEAEACERAIRELIP